MKNKPMLYAGVSTYNDEMTLDRCLESLRDFDQVIIADGKFHADLPGPPLSNDRTRDIASAYENVTVIDMPNTFSSDKKNIIQKQSRHPNDILVYIDADCYMVGDVSKLKQRLQKKPFKGVAELPMYVKYWSRNLQYNGQILYREWVLNPWQVHTPSNDHGRYFRYNKPLWTTECINYIAIIHDDSDKKHNKQHINFLNIKNAKEDKIHKAYKYTVFERIKYRLDRSRCERQRTVTKDDVYAMIKASAHPPPTRLGVGRKSRRSRDVLPCVCAHNCIAMPCH